MAVAQLADVVARLRAAGAAPGHPAALIERATLPEQRTLRGSLADIAMLAHRHRVAAPALLIVGNVAGHAPAEVLASLAAEPASTGALA